MTLAPLTTRRTSKMAQLDMEHLEGSAEEGWGWGTPTEAEEAFAEPDLRNVLGHGQELRKEVSQFSRWRQVWGAAAFPATPWLERSSSVFKRGQRSRQLHPWHFSSLKRCSIPRGVSFPPSAAAAERETWGTRPCSGSFPGSFLCNQR